MAKNAMKGKIRKGTKMHIVYQAMVDFPTDTFTSNDIWEKVIEVDKDITLLNVQNIIGSVFKKMKLTKPTTITRLGKTGRQIKVYERDLTTTQPVLYYPSLHKKSPSAPHSTNIPSSSTSSSKAKGPIPEIVDALQLGEAMIDYLNHLQYRVSDLLQTTIEIKGKARTQESDLTRKINVLTYENDGLKKANATLTTKLAQKSKTFNTSDVLNFKKQKANHGRG